MRKKGDKVVDGKVVKTEASVSIATLIEETTPASTGISLSAELKNGDEMSVNEQSVIMHIKDGRITVDMTGYWNGRLLSAAMRSIEKKYDEVRKHAVSWAMKQSQNNNLQEAV